MDTKSLAHPRTQPNGNTRELRGLALAEEHFEAIARSHRRGTYSAPSCTVSGSYVVEYTRRSESCSCPDWQHRHNACKHIIAVALIKAKTDVCSGCGSRFPRRELIELHEVNHDSLTYFHGDELCRECADNAGVCY